MPELQEGQGVKKVTLLERIPIVRDNRVPPGMAWVGYDKDGRLVYTVGINKTTP